MLYDRRVTYDEMLKTPEWFTYREVALEARGCCCEHCGNSYESRDLHIHHCGYDFERKPWEYRIDEVKVLCRDCHKAIHRRERDFMRLFESLDQETLAHLLHGLLIYKEIYERKQRCHAEHIYLYLKRQCLPTLKRASDSALDITLVEAALLKRLLPVQNDEADKLAKGVMRSEPAPDLSHIMHKLKLRRMARDFRNFLLGINGYSLDPLLDGFDYLLRLPASEQREAAYNLSRFITNLDRQYDESRLGHSDAE